MFGDGSMSRDHTFVGTSSPACTPRSTAAPIHFRRQGKGYQIYNLGGNHPVSLKNSSRPVEQVTGKTAKIQPMPGCSPRMWNARGLTDAQQGRAWLPAGNQLCVTNGRSNGSGLSRVVVSTKSFSSVRHPNPKS